MFELDKKSAKKIMSFLGVAVLLGLLDFDDYLECMIEAQYRLGIPNDYTSNYTEEEIHMYDLDD